MQHWIRVIQHKKGGSYTVIPFEIRFRVAMPKPDTVPPNMRVKPLTEEELAQYRGQTLEDAVELYMERYAQRFIGERAQRRRREVLERLLRFLHEQQGAVSPADLTLEDGQAFMASLIKADTGKPLMRSSKKKFRSGLRTFSRFLYDSWLIEQDVFRELE